MNITLDNAGKRFNRDWIFRSLSYRFETGKAYAIIGNNGSGKSTLLQSIGGATELSEGALSWQTATDNSNTTISQEHIHRYLSIVAPYLEVIEEMTAREFLDFHSSFKPLLSDFTTQQVLEAVQLKNAAAKQIRYFSSGMKQRIKLAQGLFTDVPVILLDEPCSNMDSAGFELYQSLISRFTRDRLVIVSSNDAEEYGFCREKIDIRDYKNSPANIKKEM
ncbi:ABC transporter ATP-binding protein [Arachidicoccus terrestris]|uniref:ABC transporter ATP-binding protein n=1 Tax=Arachidicoccus terrestris TaxID=2875539 RepID=UPI001CC57EF9|nr:ATP-binding cassette domain-containing protein [Arachidicoccus terrestris]UAY53868.1 ATP-binding cassette domain-containing protein [Arachidicoccus terrestris]